MSNFHPASSPTGTITFLFTDIEGSTQLWESQPDTMRAALARHDALLRQAVECNHGVVFKTTGDGIAAAFTLASEALAAALAAQQALRGEPWPAETEIRVRMGLHTGVAEYRDGDYYGQTLNRTARLMAAGQGGQILLSGVTQELCRDSLPTHATLFSLGEHRLKDLTRPETIFQVVHPDLPTLDSFSPLKTLNNPDLPNNLPQELTSFIGREKEVAEIAALLSGTRLLTLAGAGGTGKTRLSLQVAAEVLEPSRFPDGAWQVELAPLSDPSHVAQAVAQVLGVQEQGTQSIFQTLSHFLKAKRLLLILDNCEHLVAACATLCIDLLRACPGITILATSRESLNVRGEQTYRVPSLALPDLSEMNQGTFNTPEAISRFEAVRLFSDRALLVKPSFIVTNANALALAQVCAQLDGIPLAIELAAARVRSLSVEQINERLDSRFRLLTSGDRSVLPRQQTLRALIDWSYDLLRENEKMLLCRLSVFVGGWTLSASEKVCGFAPLEEWEVLDLLTSLVDKSLVQVDEVAGSTRYGLLETVRQYGIERLRANGESEVLAMRHLNWYLTLAEEAETKLGGPEQVDWLNRLEVEHGNLRAALHLAAERVEPASLLCLRLAGALARFWEVRGYLNEGRESLTRVLRTVQAMQAQRQGVVPDMRTKIAEAKVLAMLGRLATLQGDYRLECDYYEQCLPLYRESGDKHGIAFALKGFGDIAFYQGAYDLAHDYYEQCLHSYQESGDKSGIAQVHISLGSVAFYQEDYRLARDCYKQCLPLYQEIGDKRGIAFALSCLGNVALMTGDYSLARDYYEQCLPLYREGSYKRGIADVQSCLGSVATCQGDYRLARDYFEQCLLLHQEIGDKSGIVYGLEGWAELLWREGGAGTTVVEALVVWFAAAALRETLGMPLAPAEQEQAEAWLNPAQDAVRANGGGDVTLGAAEAEGRALPWQAAVKRALSK